VTSTCAACLGARRSGSAVPFVCSCRHHEVRLQRLRRRLPSSLSQLQQCRWPFTASSAHAAALVRAHRRPRLGHRFLPGGVAASPACSSRSSSTPATHDYSCRHAGTQPLLDMDWVVVGQARPMRDPRKIINEKIN
jgi:hypothetical protein